MFGDLQENMNIVTHENMRDNQIFGAKKHNIHNVKKNLHEKKKLQIYSLKSSMKSR